MKRMIVIPVLLGLFWTVLLVALFIWNVASERRHIMELAEYQARAFFQQILATRSWNSAHGGVFAPVGPNAPPNMHLPQEERLITTSSGLTLVRINPAYMTRQIAEISSQKVGVRFHITSIAPIRAENAPDVWEREALESLAPGADRFELVPGVQSNANFRYMAPLVTEESCRACHPSDALGAIRGGVSVSVPAGPLLASRESALRTLALTYGIIWFVGLMGLVGSTFEINRRREKAEELNRMKSRFLANMSHDMRTPLTGVIGLSERLARERLAPQAARYARLITHSAESLLEIVSDILDYARLDSGRLELESQPFDLRQAVEQVCAVFAFAAEEKGLEFSATVSPEAPTLLRGDSFRFRQVLANLLGNAVKFTESGGVRLEVAVEERTGGFTLLRAVVADTGVGVSPEHMARIFECFSQVDDSLSRRHAGSGLGLSIARQLARMMGGDISVTSAPGQGSSFVFTAWLEAQPERQASAEASTQVVGPAPDRTPAPLNAHELRVLQGLRVLVVDDHSANRILLRDILQEAGAEPRMVGGGPEALDSFRAEPVDLALLDLHMPGMDGAETVRRLRALETELDRTRTPIFILTAFARLEDQNLLPNEEIEGVISKPINVAELLRTIASAVEERPRSEAPVTTVQPGAALQEPELLDIEEALRLLGGRTDLYRMLAQEFLVSSPELAQGFEAAVLRGDAQEAERFVHTLKSGAASLGAERLRETAALLELQAKRQAELAPEDCRLLHDVVERTNLAIQSIRVAAPLA